MEQQATRDQVQTRVKQQEMGVIPGIYRARIGLFGRKQCKLLAFCYSTSTVRSTCTCLFGVTVVLMLVIGGKVELSHYRPGQVLSTPES